MQMIFWIFKSPSLFLEYCIQNAPLLFTCHIQQARLNIVSLFGVLHFRLKLLYWRWNPPLSRARLSPGIERTVDWKFPEKFTDCFYFTHLFVGAWAEILSSWECTIRLAVMIHDEIFVILLSFVFIRSFSFKSLFVVGLSDRTRLLGAFNAFSSYEADCSVHLFTTTMLLTLFRDCYI